MSKYSKDFIWSLEKFKRRKLDKYNADFLATLRQYAQERPYEFPTFERDLTIGSIVAGRNYVSPELHVVEQMMLNRNFPNFSTDFLWQLELFKTGQLKQYGSGFLNNLATYLKQGRPWEFASFEEDPTIGGMVKEHFYPPESSFSWIGGLAEKYKSPEPAVVAAPSPPDESESSFPPKPEPTVTPPVVLQASVTKQKPPILLMVLGGLAIGFALIELTKKGKKE